MSAAALERLLGELKAARGLRGRLRILARSFDLLRSLDRSERERVALQVGSDWAWKQLERAFMGDGRLSEGEQIIQQAFETIGTADPDELREAARRLRARDTDGLEQAAAQALERIFREDEALASEAAEPEVLPPRGEADERAGKPDLDAAIATVAKIAATDEETAPPHAPAAAVPEATDLRDPPRRRPRLPSPGQPALRHPAEPARTPTAPPAPAPPPAAPPRAATPGDTAASPPLAPSPEEPPDHGSGPSEGLGSGGIERLRLLRSLRDPGRGRSLGRVGRRQLVERLAGSWAARRAISALIASGAIADLDEALLLVERLDRDSGKTWCLIDWAETRSLDAGERERLLDAAPGPLARRRIERRLRIDGAAG